MIMKQSMKHSVLVMLALLAAFTATMWRIQNNLSAMEQRDTLSEGKDSSQ
jgi:hypothetical protein